MSDAASDVVTEALEELRQRLQGLDEGAVADYIPQLAQADPDCFGLALVSMDGTATGPATATRSSRSSR
ncbi:hypothetical protein STANM309S_06087 [Streptomyces tanashiensis]